jgi:hypothetical protein
MRGVSVVGVVLVLTLVLVASASASVRRGAFTATVSPGDDARLTVRVSPRARCTIRVEYDTVVSRARGLGAKTGTTVTWRWKVGSSTHAGRWPITVRCGKSGTLRTFIRVTG